MRTILLLLVATGMRISELIHLDWRDGVLAITPKPEEGWSPKNHQPPADRARPLRPPR
jgi:integrase